MGRGEAINQSLNQADFFFTLKCVSCLQVTGSLCTNIPKNFYQFLWYMQRFSSFSEPITTLWSIKRKTKRVRGGGWVICLFACLLLIEKFKKLWLKSFKVLSINQKYNRAPCWGMRQVKQGEVSMGGSYFIGKFRKKCDSSSRWTCQSYRQ